MKRTLLIAAVGSFLIGALILIYDVYFFHRYGMDANEILGTDGDVTIDWVTGERPTYSYFPAWVYGVAFAFVAAVLLVLRLFLPNRLKSQKTFALFMAIFATAFSSFADYTLEDIAPQLSTNAPIIWQAPTNDLPKSIWIYKKLPHVFSATTISNAVVLASFQNKGFPQPSTNRIVIWADRFEGEPMPPYFAITPENGEISFSLGDRADSSENILRDEAAVKRAWERLFQLGIDRTQLVKTNAATDGTYGVFSPRQIDGIKFYDTSEGFSFQQYGVDGKIRTYSIVLPNLERGENSPTASPQQIIACIRAYKTPVIPPQDDEFNYFERIKTLAKAIKFTITKITPCYGEGVFGETPTNNEPPKVIMPIAELEAIADFGNSNVTVRLFSPIISSEVSRLLGKSK